MKKIIWVLIISYFLLGFFAHPISELIQNRNPYLDGYLDVSWGRIEQPYFTYSNLINTILLQIVLGIVSIIFGAFIGFILIQKENYVLKYLSSFLGILFSLIFFLNESNIIRKGTSFGVGDTFDIILGGVGLLFIISFLVYFCIISINKKKNGESWKKEFFIPLIFTFVFGFFLLEGFGYAFIIPLATVFFSIIFYILFFVLKIKEK